MVEARHAISKSFCLFDLTIV